MSCTSKTGHRMRIAMAQVNFLVGEIEHNADRIIALAIEARDRLNADIILFPELTLTGYPPEDLLLRPDLYTRLNSAFKHIKKAVMGIKMVIGYPDKTDNGLYNAALVIENGACIANYHKQHLPNYGVFDEKRYFNQGADPCIIDINGIPTAIAICEDIWLSGPVAQAHTAGAKCLLCLNASPFDVQKPADRQTILRERAQEAQMPIVYAHWVSGHDELIFDGGSVVVNAKGDICKQLPFFEPALDVVEISQDETGQLHVPYAKLPPAHSEEGMIYNALVLGVRDYIEKNGFDGALVALSGGIDSALTLAIAVDAIGKEKVDAYLLPSRYTSQLSTDGAIEEANCLGVHYETISIEKPYQAFLAALKPAFGTRKPDITEENLQARCRGMIMMALSNKKHKIVLTTGNKSEMAVGYSTLYGDMAGGFCVLKDVAKTMVYRLAHYRNRLDPVIPQKVIDRPPTAELAPDQCDQDSLPPYEILDQILSLYVEKDESVETIVKKGFDERIVRHIVCLVDRNEYKRRQAPLGIRITPRAFGRDRRYPVTSGFSNKYKNKAS